MVERSGTDTDRMNDYIPQHLQPGLVRYLEQGIMPGSFLQAVLENKLMEAFERADATSRAAIGSIVHYLYNYAPMAAWGSPERVHDWSELKRRSVSA